MKNKARVTTVIQGIDEDALMAEIGFENADASYKVSEERRAYVLSANCIKALAAEMDKAPLATVPARGEARTTKVRGAEYEDSVTIFVKEGEVGLAQFVFGILNTETGILQKFCKRMPKVKGLIERGNFSGENFAVWAGFADNEADKVDIAAAFPDLKPEDFHARKPRNKQSDPTIAQTAAGAVSIAALAGARR
jgi:hypothetical protein